MGHRTPSQNFTQREKQICDAYVENPNYKTVAQNLQLDVSYVKDVVGSPQGAGHILVESKRRLALGMPLALATIQDVMTSSASKQADKLSAAKWWAEQGLGKAPEADTAPVNVAELISEIQQIKEDLSVTPALKDLVIDLDKNEFKEVEDDGNPDSE